MLRREYVSTMCGRTRQAKGLVAKTPQRGQNNKCRNTAKGMKVVRPKVGEEKWKCVRTGRMSARKAAEAIVELFEIGSRANAGVNQRPAVGDVLSKTADSIPRKGSEVRLAARE